MKKTSEEIMNEIESYDKKIERLRYLNDEVCSLEEEEERKELRNWWVKTFKNCLQAQKQERLDCYKKELEFLDVTRCQDNCENVKELIYNRMNFLKQEIKILEGK
ncbi:MAG TPA: hypothetical protein VMZ91_16770 [Candidatus Paceibacterota bacterium]|nr:hypothetical protein [Candidatus Paceibacterota bacterium]